MYSRLTGSSALRAKSQWFEGVYFPSKIELETYKTLRKYFPSSELSVHHYVPIFPKSQRFSAMGWNVDFYVPELNLYIESKGHIPAIENREWLTKMRVIDQLNPSFLDRLIVVSGKPGQSLWGGAVTSSLPKLDHVIGSLKKRQ